MLQLSPPRPLPSPRQERAPHVRISWHVYTDLVARANGTTSSSANASFDGLPISSEDFHQYTTKAWYAANSTQRHAHFASRAESLVRSAVSAIWAVPDEAWSDARAVETLLCTLGINDEMLVAMPVEFARCYGRGLHIWQYPNQLTRYLQWLISVAAMDVDSYAEIGCRWGGMFIVVSEVLRRYSRPGLRWVAAIDPIGKSPLMRAYESHLKHLTTPVAFHFFTAYSTDRTLESRLIELAPRLLFVDGDHHLEPARHDHALAEAAGAKYIVHHDVVSDTCRSHLVWNQLLREANASGGLVAAVEFTAQYAGVHGDWLGIGVLARKPAPYMAPLLHGESSSRHTKFQEQRRLPVLVPSWHDRYLRVRGAHGGNRTMSYPVVGVV